VRVLVACEFSGVVRDAFTRAGHSAISCDLLPSESPGEHYQGELRHCISEMFNRFDIPDLMIAHPPCTRLSNSGVKHLYIDGLEKNGRDEKAWIDLEEAAYFYNWVAGLPIERKAIENPIMHRHARVLVNGKATQYVQPWWFGDKKNKATGFRLINLPKLIKTNVVGPMPKTILKGTPEYRSWNEVWYMSPGPDRAKNRARTYPSVAKAMAEQWGVL
jgi:hypothetical protein